MTTVRIAHMADRHVYEGRSLEDTVRVQEAFLEQARSRGVRLIVDAGDMYQRKSTPMERNVQAEFIQRCAEIAPVVGVRGNHDAPGDIDILAMLESNDDIYMFDRPQVTGVGVGDLVVLSLPWFDKASIVSNLPADADSSSTTQRTIDAAQNILTIIRTAAADVRRDGYTPILVAHVQVAGAETSTGQTLIGTTVELSPSDLRDTGAEYVALGHIHKRQDWYEGRVSYAGSFERMNFGEPEPKGWNLVTFEDGKFAGVEFVELPARRIVLIEEDLTGIPLELAADRFAPYCIRDAAVRYRYRIASGQLHLVDEQVIKRFMLDVLGAHSVTLEAIIEHEDRIRCVELAAAKTLWEKVQAYWIAKGIDPIPEQRERVRLKLAEIESPGQAEVSHAA